MRKVRIGNDINVRWEVKTDGQAVSLEGKALKLYVRSAYRKEEITTFTVEGCVVSFTYPASMQRMTGARAVILEDATEGAPRRTVCADQAFTLVAHSCEENDDDVEFEDFMISLQSNVLIGKPGLSAYEVWLSEGNTGTLEDWYAFLRKPATDIASDVAAAEAERTTAETARDKAEQARQGDENLRKIAEENRASAETGRSDAEQRRDANETSRESAEQMRKSAEADRIRDEKEREEAETSRKAAEKFRDTAENDRNDAEQERRQHEDARADAEGKRDTAETLRKQAETGRDNAEQERTTAEQTRKDSETSRVAAERERTASEQTRQENETTRVSAETERVLAELSRQRAEAKREQAAKDNKASNDAAVAAAKAATAAADTATGKANTAATNADTATENANAAADAASKVNAVMGDDHVLTVTDRTGAVKTADLGDVSDVARLKRSLGPYSERPDIVLTPSEQNVAISADGVKVAKTGWAIAEFTAEKGNVYLFKPNVIDGSVCIFSEYIQSVETRGIDYTYTYNTDGTVASASATYLGTTHIYTYTYAEDKSCTITDEAGAVVKTLPMVYETKVGTYSPLVSLNADAELPKDGYCRYMSHFKGNSAIKVAVSYKVGVADLTMKVTRDGVLASISTQLGNLSQKEDETRKKIDELHGSYADLLFKSDWTISTDDVAKTINGKKKTRVYPKSSLGMNGLYNKFTPLVWMDISSLKGLSSLGSRFSGGFQGCTSLKTVYSTGTDVSKLTSLYLLFDNCTSLESIDVGVWDVENVTTFEQMFGNCTSLKNINVSAWNTSRATSLKKMFLNCVSLTNIDVSDWDVSNVRTLQEMFYGCKILNHIDVSRWNVGNVTSINNLFYECNSLESIDVSKWDVRKLKTFVGFLQQNKIKSLDLSGWDLESCTNLKFTSYTLPWVTLKLGPLFFHCPKVSSVDWTGLASWTDASVRESLVTNSYDRKTNGLPDLTLTLSSQTKAVLSEDDIATMTTKGYIIA